MFFVDPMVGHRALNALKSSPRTRRFIRDRVNSNTHMVIIRKREAPRAPFWRCHTKRMTSMIGGFALHGMLDTANVAQSRAAIQDYLRSAGGGQCKPAKWGCLDAAVKQSAEPAERCGGTCLDTSFDAVSN